MIASAACILPCEFCLSSSGATLISIRATDSKTWNYGTKQLVYLLAV